jgi:hypothetical protein
MPIYEKSLQFLGFIISQDGIGPDQTKIQKIACYKPLISPYEVRSFLA